MSVSADRVSYGVLLICRQCGRGYRVRQRDATTSKYCSKSCYSLACRANVGPLNNAFRDAGKKTCVGCGREYRSYNKTRQYCSRQCHVKNRTFTESQLAHQKAFGSFKYPYTTPRNLLKKREKLGRKLTCFACGVVFYRVSKRKYCDACRHVGRSMGWQAAQRHWKARIKKMTGCLFCGTKFYAPPSAKRIYCSYDCHIASGGAIRAGLESFKMTSIYGAKKDANHKDVVKELKERGVPFIDLSPLGCGIPDLVVENCGKLELWEIKNPKTSYGRRGLNKNQVAWAAKWAGNPVRIIKSVADAIDALEKK